MSKKGYSRPGLFGTMKHYDADGNFIGESRPGWLGSMENYDANGNKTGESRPGWLGSMENYDANGNKIGESRPDCFGKRNGFRKIQIYLLIMFAHIFEAYIEGIIYVSLIIYICSCCTHKAVSG